MLRYFLFCFVLMLVLTAKNSSAQTNWIRFNQLDSMERAEKRPVLIFVTAPWCVYCKAMKSTTFRNSKVAAELNANFYVLELNAEQNQEIDFNGKKYRYISNTTKSGLQELAVDLALVNGQISYPTLVFLKPGEQGKFVYPAYSNARQLLKMAKTIKK